MNSQEVFTMKEVAELLKVDLQTVKRYIKQGKLKAITLSPHVIRILRSEIDYLLGKEAA
jgi:excisionase family DNA binding protein